MKIFATLSTLIKDIPNGENIVSDLRVIETESREEAIGKYVLEISEQFPEHYIHCRPLVIEIIGIPYEEENV